MDTTYLKIKAPILSSLHSFLGYIALEPPSSRPRGSTNVGLLLSLSLHVLEYLVLYIYMWDLEDNK